MPDSPEDKTTVIRAFAPGGAPPDIPDHQLIRRIGSGSYGEVWLAKNVLGAYRAVKIVYRKSFESDRPYEREFSGIKKFEPVSRSHDSQVDILHVGRNDKAGYFFYIMELADPQTNGRQLDPETYTPKTLRSEIQQRGRLPAKECQQLALALTGALAHLHKSGLIHRDIKPSNIIFVNGRPKLADIGLVAGIADTNSFVGTEGYLPPEGPGTAKADIYSLGKVLYEIATGRDRNDFPELPTDLCDFPDRDELIALNQVILKACDAKPHKRYASADKMNADIPRLASAERPKSKSIISLSFAVGLLGFCLAVGLMIPWFRQQPTRKASSSLPEAIPILTEVTVSTDPPYGVRVGTNRADLTLDAPARILLPPGTNTIYARHNDLGSTSKSFMLMPGKTNLQIAYVYGRVGLTANVSNVNVTIATLGRTVDLDREASLTLPLGRYSFEGVWPGFQSPARKVLAGIVAGSHKHEPLSVHFEFEVAKVIFASSPDLGADVYDERRVFMGAANGTTEMIVPVGKRTFYFVGAKEKKTNTVIRELASIGPHKIESDFSKPVNFITTFGMEFVWVENLTNYVGVSEVTQSQYETVMKNNPSVGPRSANHPVNSVTYNQAIQFCRELERFAPPPAGFYYTLPTEQQWRVFVGNAFTNGALAVIKTTNAAPVRSKPPNEYRLYDVRGNVFEWMLDGWPAGSGYASPRLAAEPLSLRLAVPPGGNYADKTVGFRVVLVPKTI